MTEELYVIVALEYIYSKENRAAERHYLYHGPATKQSCEALKSVLENDEGYGWNVYYNIFTHDDYLKGKYE
ncbi:hypothetical protein Ea92_04 [Erwinia phage Ea9-2]|uniref:Uncharacterized protein n=1 Tax=Erwinia phage Ea9-2 TaxID=1429767 RepID=W6ASI6_9CAUD|nr:hypothetical protein Ea92_04 [Erwinia phage Ea9-2]AHI60060.1 hypothetical protein Ea92_04 [Erwinia phage Ea9-2]